MTLADSYKYQQDYEFCRCDGKPPWYCHLCDSILASDGEACTGDVESAFDRVAHQAYGPKEPLTFEEYAAINKRWERASGLFLNVENTTERVCLLIDIEVEKIEKEAKSVVEANKSLVLTRRSMFLRRAQSLLREAADLWKEFG